MAVEEPSAVRSKLVFVSGLLMALSCQPYNDHPLEDGFSAELHARGARRRLALESVKVSPDSLLLVFNQPLRDLQQSVAPPFEPSIRPPVAIKQVQFEGAAGLRVVFQNPLPASRTYTVDIPPGWRSPTGSALAQPIHQVWTSPATKVEKPSLPTPSPAEPLKLLRSTWDREAGAQLTFSSAVSAEELRRCLVAVPEQTSPRLEKQAGASWKLKFDRGVPRTLVLTAGLRDLVGGSLKESVLLDVGTLEGVEETSRSQGWIGLPQRFAAPGEPMLVVGGDSKSEFDRGVLTVHDSEGAIVWSSRLSWSASFGFVSRFSAPSGVGRYQVRFQPVEGAAWTSDFQVCPTAAPGESYRFDSARETPQKVKLEQTGPQHRDVRLRAYITAAEESEDYPLEWTRISHTVPNWTLLAEASGDELAWTVPKAWSRPASVVVEALDLHHSGLLLTRTERPLPASAPWLTLRGDRGQAGSRSQARELMAVVSGLPLEDLPAKSVNACLDYRAPGKKEWEEVARHEDFATVSWRVPTFLEGRYRLRVSAHVAGKMALNEVFEREVASGLPQVGTDAAPRVERGDQRQGDVRMAESVRLTGSPDAAVGWTSVERVGQPKSHLGPERFPLLSPTHLKAGENAAWRLDRHGSARLTAPKQAGAYRVWTYSPRSTPSKLEGLDLEVGDIARWEVRTPVGVRPGDRFQAGLEFFPGPLNGSVGLTAAAEAGGLLPSGYHSTSAVAKGKPQRVVFDYEAPWDATSPLHLAWAAGHSGNRQELSEQVLVWPQVWTPRLLAKDRLGPGQVRRFASDGAWRLVISPPVAGRPPVRVAVETPEGGTQMRTLAALDSPWILGTKKASLVRLEHRGGGPMFFQWSRLELDEGKVTAWASRAYLATLALNGDGSPAGHWSQSKGMGLLISLINPKGALSGTVRIPLPAGAEPQSLLPWNQEAKKLPWSYEQGVLEFKIRDLPEGEFLWKVALEPRAAGEFLWPSAQLVSPQAELWALSGSSRMEIRP